MPGRARSAIRRRSPWSARSSARRCWRCCRSPRERDVPLLTISGTARLSEMGVPQFFRFFPSDATVKVAHARYVVEKLGAKRPAVIYQSTAYGQSGREQLAKTFAELKTPPVLEESVAPDRQRPHAGAAARQGGQRRRASCCICMRRRPCWPYARRASCCPTCRSSPARRCISRPPRRCSSRPSSRASAPKPPPRRSPRRRRPMRDFLAAYRAAYKSDPDAFAAAQFDAVRMLGRRDRRPAARRRRASTPAKVRESLGDGALRRAWSRPTGRTARATWRTRPRSSASTAPTACRGRWRATRSDVRPHPGHDLVRRRTFFLFGTELTL